MCCFRICILYGFLFMLPSLCLWTEEKKQELTSEAIASKFGDKNLQPKDRAPLPRQYALAVINEKKQKEGIDFLTSLLKTELNATPKGTVNTTTLAMQANIVDAISFLSRFSQGIDFAKDSEFAHWLLDSDTHLTDLCDNVEPQDNIPAALALLQSLCHHDPKERDKYFNLIVALALVWDQERPKPHFQMGNKVLPYQTDICARYDYFKALYSDSAKKKAKISYSKLLISDFTFVVDTPMPISELEWARDNVKGTAASWGKRYAEIKYDHPRLNGGVFAWPSNQGEYSLSSILKYGGICIDQAYYSAMTARANGIPCLFFTGEGRRGGHAWFGYMKAVGKWELDVGRYAYDNYAVGQALNPQTNQKMTDHDVEFACNRIFRDEKFDAAVQITKVADAILAAGDEERADGYARQAISKAPLFNRPWQIRENVIVKRGDKKKLLDLYHEQSAVFKKYPDYLMIMQQKEIDLLKELGKTEEADKLFKEMQNKISKKRDDLDLAIADTQLDALLKEKKNVEARKFLEDLLEKQRGEVRKLPTLLDAYMKITKETEQTKDAVKFLKNYVKKDNTLMKYVIQAYENDGDQKNADKLKAKYP